MTKTIICRKGQTLFDIALQNCGSIDAVFEIASLNDTSISTLPDTGMPLNIPVPKSGKIVKYYKDNNIIPATAM